MILWHCRCHDKCTRAVNVRETKLPDVQKELGMSEGFDVGLEMSGSPAGFRDMIANMSHGAKIAMLGVWDTVGALGIPEPFFVGLDSQLFGFLSTDLHPDMLKAYHAVSIDELVTLLDS